MYLIIADSHEISGAKSEFFEMLDAISKTSYDVIFLGDIMDLWIAKDKYEDAIQNDFAAWCKKEISKRRIYYVEGNHEFFVESKYNGVIGKVSTDNIRTDGMLIAHGHKIQGGFFNFTRIFLALAKSMFGSAVLNVMPNGRAFAAYMKKKMGSRTHFNCCNHIPETAVRKWCKKNADENTSDIFIGHFHIAGDYDINEKTKCHILPSWKENKEVALFDSNTRTFKTENWHALITPCQS